MSVQIENVLIVDDVAERAMRVRAAAKLESNFKSIAVVSSSAHAIERLKVQEFQLVFFAVELLLDGTQAFLDAARKTRGAQVATFVSLITAESGDNAHVTQVLKGTDGVLIEPFSINSFQEIVHIATTLLRERTTEMQKRLIEVALVDAITYVDSTASRIKADSRKKSGSRALARLSATLEDCHDIDPELYFEILIERMIALSCRKRKSRTYSGASERLRKRMEKQYAAELLKKDPEDTDS